MQFEMQEFEDFPTIAPEELGEFPDSWKVVPLGDCLTEAQYGLSVKGGADGRCPVLRMTNQVNGQITNKNLQYANVSDRELERFRLRRGDILFNRTNSFDLVGRTGIFDLEGEFIFASYLIRLRTKPELLDPFFLNYYLIAAETQRRLKSIATRAVSQSNISATRLKGFPVPVPPLSVQREIVATLSAVQKAIEQQDRLIQTTAELKRALLQKLFSQGLRGEPQKETEIGLVPESWEVCTIGSLGTVVTGGTPKTTVPEYYAPPEIDFIAPADLGQTRLVYNSQKKISSAGLKTIRVLPKNAVMCVCIGSSIGKVGMTSKGESATNQQINSVVPNKEHDAAFIYYLLTYYAKYWRGFATFGPVPILSKGGFESISIVTPSEKAEESEIAQLLIVIDEKVEMHVRRKNLLCNLFSSLLHQLMSGQITVEELFLTATARLAESGAPIWE